MASQMREKILCSSLQKDDLSMFTDKSLPISPVEYFSFLDADSTNICDCHWHESAEMVFVLNGHMQYYVQSNVFDLHAGDALLIGPHTLHFPISAPMVNGCFEKTTFRLDLIQDSPAYTQACIVLEKNNCIYMPASSVSTTSIQAALSSLNLELCKATPSKDLIHAYVGQIVHSFCRHYISKVTKLFDDDMISRLQAYLLAHYPEKIYISDLAEALHVSKSTCVRIIRLAFNMTPTELILDYRLWVASNLLRQTNLTVQEIAMRCGMEQSYLAELFRKRRNCSPSEYRMRGTCL